jgi:formamidopyrimidine-DNA glycosylase
MPELPEVETVRLQLLHKIVGKKIANIEIFNSKTVGSRVDFSELLKGKIFSHIDRVGKLMIFSFKNQPDLFLLTHLKMTGQFFFLDKKGVSGGGHSVVAKDFKNLPNQHTRVAFHFTDKSALFFNDMRKFGYMKLATKDEVEKTKGNYGPEPIHTDFDTTKFHLGLKNRKTSIKATLLNQSFVAGLGNIYVDEALFIAKVRPDRKANLITKKEAIAIAKASGAVMNKSIAVGGTTFQHFVDTDGDYGNYSDYLQVFGKQGGPCPVCKTLIKKTKVAGRGTHFCPKCQK